MNQNEPTEQAWKTKLYNVPHVFDEVGSDLITLGERFETIAASMEDFVAYALDEIPALRREVEALKERQDG